MTNDKHVGVVPSTRATKIKEPVIVVPIEVNYALEGKVWNFIDIWIGQDEDDLSIMPIMFLGESAIFKHLIIWCRWRWPGHWTSCLERHRSSAKDCKPEFFILIFPCTILFKKIAHHIFLSFDIFLKNTQFESPPLSQQYSLAEFRDGSVILNGRTHETENWSFQEKYKMITGWHMFPVKEYTFAV